MAQYVSWRWEFWLVLCAAAPVTLFLATCTKETCHKVLIARKTAQLCKELGRTDLTNCYEGAPPMSPTSTPAVPPGLRHPSESQEDPASEPIYVARTVVPSRMYVAETKPTPAPTSAPTSVVYPQARPAEHNRSWADIVKA